MDAIEDFKVGRFTVRIHLDEDGPNPRTDYDHPGTVMACWHRRYSLGDKGATRGMDPEDFATWLESERAIRLPLWLYDHSGITMSTSAFGCPWDSGQVGWIYMLPADVRSEYDCKRITPTIRRKVLEWLEAEVREYDSYIRGEVYGFTIEDEDGENVESRWGFIGDIDYVMSEARRVAEHAEADAVAAEACRFPVADVFMGAPS